MRRCEIRVPKFNSVEAENGAKTDNRREVTNLGSLQFSQVGRLSRKITVPRSYSYSTAIVHNRVSDLASIVGLLRLQPLPSISTCAYSRV